MKTQRLLIVLTVANLALLLSWRANPEPVHASDVAPVLRGRAFEIVDGQGHVRASISVLPADPHYKMPDGTTGYPETVLFRLINSKAQRGAYVAPPYRTGTPQRPAARGAPFCARSSEGQPNVKIESDEQGAAMGLVADSQPANVLIRAKGARAELTVTGRDGRSQLVKP